MAYLQDWESSGTDRGRGLKKYSIYNILLQAVELKKLLFKFNEMCLN